MKHHLALMSPFFMNKILSGQKIIETRLTKTKRSRYKMIEIEDKIYFKEVAGQVKASAIVKKVKYYEQSEIPEVIHSFIKPNQKNIGFDTDLQLKNFLCEKNDINFISILWLKDVYNEQFKVDSKKYAYRNGWVVLNNIEQIKL